MTKCLQGYCKRNKGNEWMGTYPLKTWEKMQVYFLESWVFIYLSSHLAINIDTTPLSDRVVMSPNFNLSSSSVSFPVTSPLAIFRRIRLIIFPERVFGNSVTRIIFFGVANGPIWLRTAEMRPKVILLEFVIEFKTDGFERMVDELRVSLKFAVGTQKQTTAWLSPKKIFEKNGNGFKKSMSNPFWLMFK